MEDEYEVTGRTRIKAVLLGVWVVLTDTLFTSVARLGGCGDTNKLDAQLLGQLWTTTEVCGGSELAGPSIRLIPHPHAGALLGLGADLFSGFVGQLYALGLMLVATVLSILVARWDERSGGDALALALIWSGAMVESFPRLLGDGRGLAELELFGASTGIGELAFLWGIAWLATRRIAHALA